MPDNVLSDTHLRLISYRVTHCTFVSVLTFYIIENECDYVAFKRTLVDISQLSDSDRS